MGRSQLRPNLFAGGCRRDPIVQGATESLGDGRGLCVSLNCEHGHEMSWEKSAGEERGRSLLEAHTMVDDSFCACGPGQALGWLPVVWVSLYLKGNTSPSTTPGPPQGEGSAMGPPFSPDASTEPRSNGTQEVHSTAAQALTLRDLQDPSPNRDAFDPRRLH